MNQPGFWACCKITYLGVNASIFICTLLFKLSKTITYALLDVSFFHCAALNTLWNVVLHYVNDKVPEILQSHDFGPESQISAPNEGPNRRRWTLRCSSAETLRGCRQPIIRTLFTAQLREPLPKNNLHQKVFSSALLGIMELIMKNCHDTGCFLLQRP